MNVRMVVSPNGRNASSAGTAPSSAIAAMPSSPPTGIGTGSVIQSTTTSSRTAASVCWA